MNTLCREDLNLWILDRGYLTTRKFKERKIYFFCKKVYILKDLGNIFLKNIYIKYIKL